MLDRFCFLIFFIVYVRLSSSEEMSLESLEDGSHAIVHCFILLIFPIHPLLSRFTSVFDLLLDPFLIILHTHTISHTYTYIEKHSLKKAQEDSIPLSHWVQEPIEIQHISCVGCHFFNTSPYLSDSSKCSLQNNSEAHWVTTLSRCIRDHSRLKWAVIFFRSPLNNALCITTNPFCRPCYWRKFRCIWFTVNSIHCFSLNFLCSALNSV